MCPCPSSAEAMAAPCSPSRAARPPRALCSALQQGEATSGSPALRQYVSSMPGPSPHRWTPQCTLMGPPDKRAGSCPGSSMKRRCVVGTQQISVRSVLESVLKSAPFLTPVKHTLQVCSVRAMGLGPSYAFSFNLHNNLKRQLLLFFPIC